MSLLLGLDIGTQAVKGVLVRPEGTVVARASLERGPQHPRPGWVEMDAARDWWGYAVQAVHALLAAVPGPAPVAAVGVSALVPCLCPLDEAGAPLRPAILYSDNRALAELAWANARLATPLTAQAVTPKLRWLQQHEPETMARTRTILSAHNYVVYRLTGELSMDYDTASILGGIFDPTTRQWDTAACQALELPLTCWPPLYPATAIVGRVTAEAARATGLPAGTPVIAGTGDTFPTIVGCGAVEPGDAMIAFGTTGLLTVTRRPLVESAAGPHFDDAAGGAAVTWGANVLSAGRLVRWFVETFAQAECTVAARTGSDPFTLLEAGASRIPPGAEGLFALPHWLGRRTPTPDPHLRGALLGLTPSHNLSHIYRAVLESFAYNLRQGFDPLRPAVRRLVATSGGARSPLWRQIVADTLDAPLEYHPQSGGPLGSAFLAGYASGLIDDFMAIKQRWLCQAETTLPDPAAVACYRQLFPLYETFDQALAEPFARLAREWPATASGTPQTGAF